MTKGHGGTSVTAHVRMHSIRRVHPPLDHTIFGSFKGERKSASSGEVLDTATQFFHVINCGSLDPSAQKRYGSLQIRTCLLSKVKQHGCEVMIEVCIGLGQKFSIGVNME